jgi:hypothetical protein
MAIINNAPAFCFITGLPAVNIPSQWDNIKYAVKIGPKSYLLVFEIGYCPSEKVKENKEILIDQLVKGNIPEEKPLNNYFLETLVDKALACDHSRD